MIDCFLLIIKRCSSVSFPATALCLVAQPCPTRCDATDCSPPGSVHRTLQARVLEWVAMPSSRGSSRLRDQTQVSCIAGRFFIIWATREARDAGVGNLSLLQGVFPTQKSNQGLLHCRQILYQLSYQGSPVAALDMSCVPQSKFFLYPSLFWTLLPMSGERRGPGWEVTQFTHTLPIPALHPGLPLPGPPSM